MKRTLFIFALLASFASSQAQEKLSREECLKYAFIVSADLKDLLNTPIPTDPDVKRPAGIKDEGCGALVLPETKLAQAFAGIGKEVVPVGQLWMAGLLPMSEGQAIAAEKLRLVRLTAGDRERVVPCFALGARKDANGGLEMLVYGKGAEPLLRLPLKAISTGQEVPIDLSGERKDDGNGVLTFRFLGKYEAALNVRRTGQE
ncbi:exported hypothetical protein [Verrucomicrobia bacterium]|nr:exported hypothetical protein [Verrucomicrobiota bacterium]